MSPQAHPPIDRSQRVPPAGWVRETSGLIVPALAYVGGVIGYLPLLTMLLPLKIEAVSGDARLGAFTATVIAGAIAASLSNLLFGWLSDLTLARGYGRRRWLAGGLVATALSYVWLARAPGAHEIVLAVFVYQIALNAALAPLIAIIAEEVPDARKGVMGGLMAFANPVASGVLAIVIGVGTVDMDGRLAVVVAAMALCLAPMLLTPAAPFAATVSDAVVAMRRRDLAAAWCARLLVQVSGVVLQLYLLYYFESISGPMPPDAIAARIGHLLTLSFLLPLPIAVIVGRLSDRIDRRKPFLLAAAIVAAMGLAGMAFARDWAGGAIFFTLYAVGAGVFLPLQNVFSMQLLPNPRRRGRDLGLLNLTNTLPSLVGPMLTWMLATPRDFAPLMLTLVALTLCGGLAMMTVRGRS